jgi:hypothetical protein
MLATIDQIVQPFCLLMRQLFLRHCLGHSAFCDSHAHTIRSGAKSSGQTSRWMSLNDHLILQEAAPSWHSPGIVQTREMAVGHGLVVLWGRYIAGESSATQAGYRRATKSSNDYVGQGKHAQ